MVRAVAAARWGILVLTLNLLVPCTRLLASSATAADAPSSGACGIPVAVFEMLFQGTTRPIPQEGVLLANLSMRVASPPTIRELSSAIRPGADSSDAPRLVWARFHVRADTTFERILGPSGAAFSIAMLPDGSGSLIRVLRGPATPGDETGPTALERRLSGREVWLLPLRIDDEDFTLAVFALKPRTPPETGIRMQTEFFKDIAPARRRGPWLELRADVPD